MVWSASSPLSFSTRTELSAISVVSDVENIPMMLNNKQMKVIKPKIKSPASVARVYFRKSLIMTKKYSLTLCVHYIMHELLANLLIFLEIMS